MSHLKVDLEMNLKNRRMLVVGMIDSPHLTHWLREIASMNLFSSIYIFPSTSPKSAGTLNAFKPASPIRVIGIFPAKRLTALLFTFLDKTLGLKWRSAFLSLSIMVLRPSLVHIHELQHGGYLLDENILRMRKLKILCSTWGSDLVLYGKLETHREKLANVLKRIDFLLTERNIELGIAADLGFKGIAISPSYVTIGAEDFEESGLPPSKRKKIVIKGYQDNHGRALNVLQALTTIKESLEPFEVVVISASESVQVMVECMKSDFHINIVCAPKLNRTEIYRLFKESRVYVGLAISDGISNTMIESMQTGAFPIQSVNSCAPEFIQDGISGFIVDPWDIATLASHIKRSLTDDQLVDNAVLLNLQSLREKYSRKDGLKKLQDLYQGILDE
jgi:glycosyltransferase involved in cell wall biosynthesis